MQMSVRWSRMEPGWMSRRSGRVSRSHSGKSRATPRFPLPLWFLFQPLCSLSVSLCKTLTAVHAWSPTACLSVLSPSSSTDSPILPPFIFHFISHIISFSFILYAFSLLTSLATLSSLTCLSCSISPSSAGSEHFLLGENLTVAVLGVVIPIGKSPGAFLSACVHPHSRPPGQRKAAVYLLPVAGLFVVHSQWSCCGRMREAWPTGLSRWCSSGVIFCCVCHTALFTSHCVVVLGSATARLVSRPFVSVYLAYSSVARKEVKVDAPKWKKKSSHVAVPLYTELFLHLSSTYFSGTAHEVCTSHHWQIYHSNFLDFREHHTKSGFSFLAGSCLFSRLKWPAVASRFYQS